MANNQRGTRRHMTTPEEKRIIYQMAILNKSVREISLTLQIADSTIRAILKRINNGQGFDNNYGRVYQTKLSEQEGQTIKEWVLDDCTYTLPKLQTKIYNIFGKTVSTSTISRTLSGLNFSIKRIRTEPEARNSVEIKEKRVIYEQEYVSLSSQFTRNKIYFLDETAIEINMRPFYGRAIKGQPAVVKTPTLRSAKFTICAAMSCDGDKFYQYVQGNYNGNLFSGFVRNLLERLQNNGINNPCLIMDNASIHHVAQVTELKDQYGANITYLPPYSPALNPIENLFSKWKNFIRCQQCNTYEELIEAVENGLNTISREDCMGYESNMVMHLNLARNRQDI